MQDPQIERKSFALLRTLGGKERDKKGEQVNKGFEERNTHICSYKLEELVCIACDIVLRIKGGGGGVAFIIVGISEFCKEGRSLG